MEKAYSRIKWENYPSISTPLNETNLNKMDMSLDEVDNRVLGLDTAKLDKAVANSMVKEITFNEATGIFTITSLDGTTKTIDTKLEKVATNFSYDYETQKLKLTLLDGTEQEIDMSTLISQYEFADTSTIGFTVGNEGKITAIVKDGSITEDKLQPNFLSDIKVEVAKGKSYSDSSYENATTSSNASKEAKQYRDEAKQFRDEVEAVVDVDIATTEKAGLVKPDGTTIRVDEDGTIHADAGTVDYTELENKPSINGTELEGNKTLDDLGIASKGKVESLETELEKTTYKVDTVIEKADLGIKETATGEELHLIDSAEGKAVEFALYGKAKQNTTTGKNLLKNNNISRTLKGVTFTVNDDGSIYVKGKAEEATAYILESYNDLLKRLPTSGTIYLSGCTDGSNTTYDLRVQAQLNGSGQAYACYNSPRKITYNTIEERENFNAYINILSGVEVDTTIYPMISVDGGEYEPFTNGASPNPQYPQPIEVSGESGSVVVKSCGKNFLKNTLTSRENYGISYTINNDGSFSLKGTNTNSGVIAFELNRITLKAGTYKVSCFNGQKNKCRLNVYNSADNSIFVQQDDEEKTFTLKEETKIRVAVIAVSGATIDTIGYPMISLDGGEYQPYKETLSTIPTENGLAGIKVSEGGNYTDQNGQQWICDEIVKYADGSGAYIQRIENILLKSSFPWQISSSTVGRYLLGTPLKENIAPLCSHFIGETVDVKTHGVAFNNLGMQLCFNTEFETIEEWKSWIDSNEVLTMYALAEPIHTPLTAEEIAEIEKLHTFYPITNISNDFDCGMSVKYNCDSKNYIDNKIALLTTAMVNNI